MLESMEDDDNMIVLVVGDEENTKNIQKAQVVLCPITIKVEPEEESIKSKPGNEIFESPAHTEGQKNKGKYSTEFLEEYDMREENEVKTEEYDTEYLEEEVEFERDNDHEDYSDHENKKIRKAVQQEMTPKKNSPQNMTPQLKTLVKNTSQNNISFVKQLREDYPEMAENDQLLVKHLAGIMREIKPPDPPKNYYKEIQGEGGKVKYQCALCRMLSDTLPIAARHYQCNHGEFYLSCYACGAKYRNTPNLYKHEKRCSAPDSKLVLRARGYYLGRKGRGRPFTTTNRFSPSTIVKKEKSRLFCSKCPASFVHRENLVAHENSHDGVRPFRCHQCTMAYTSYPALKRHLKLHGNVKYICDHCGREFKLKPALVSHLDSHRPVRKHGCLYCERRYAQKPALRHHMNKVHLNLPAAHGCPVCPKRYARLTHVKEHMNRVHGLTMITRRMYFQALPTMTDAEVTKAREFFSLKVNQSESVESVILSPSKKPKHILPGVLEETTDDSTKERYVKIFKKRKRKIDLNAVPEKTTNDSDITTSQMVKAKINKNNENEITSEKNLKSKTKQNNETETTPEKTQTETLKPTTIRRPSQFQNNKDFESPTKVEQLPEKKKRDDEIYKVVRDIKSTLRNRKIPNRAEKKKPTQNFLEIKWDFINQLKNEIETRTEPQKEKPEDTSPNHLVSQKIKSEEDESDDEEWKSYKDAIEKNKVITEFLEYMKSGVVPKHVPILRRRGPTKGEI